MTFQELKAAYLHLDYEEFTNKIQKNLQDGLKNISPSEVASRDDHRDYLTLLNKYRMAIDAGTQFYGANFKERITAMLSAGEDGVYTNSLRYIFELIQNVDDCEFRERTNCSLRINFDEQAGKIILFYNETGFTPFNVFAVTGIAEAAKNISDGNVQIGEKGIGFKSVFGVAHRVWIQSGKFSFELDGKNFCVPIPVYDARYEEIPGTKLTLFMESSKVRDTYKKICKNYRNSDAVFQNNPILFLNKLTDISFCDHEGKTLTFSVSREKDIEGINNSFEPNVHLGAVFSGFGSNLDEDCSINCVRYTLPIKFNREQCISRYDTSTKLTNQTLRMQVIFPEVSELSKISQGAFYSYLPTEVRLNIPVACHVPFKLDTSREYVDSQNQNQWFAHCCSEFSLLMRSAYRHYAQKYTVTSKHYNEVVYFLPSVNEPLFKQTNDRIKCLDRPEFRGNTFSQRDIFYSALGNFKPARELCYFQSERPLINPQKLCSFLKISLEAFILPDPKIKKDFGIKKIEAVGEKLFNRAFEFNAPTQEIFQYIDSQNLLEENSWNYLVQRLSNRTLSLSQVRVILNYPACYQAFCRKCTDQKNHISNSGIQISAASNSAVDILLSDPSDEMFEMESFPTSLQNYFRRIVHTCYVLENAPTAFFIADNAVILSGNVLAALSELCNRVDRQNLFALQLKYREVSRTLNNADGNLSDIEYLNLLRSLRSSQREALGSTQYQSYIHLLKDSSMTSDRFLSELLQNADDCTYPEGAIPSFSLKIAEKTITTEYNECGFTRSNVRAITAIGESTKKRLDSDSSIGEKGVGFKSVFSVASKVCIHSGPFHFALSKERPTIPQILGSINEENTTGTKMILFMDQPLSAQLQSSGNILQLCLCLRKLKEIQIGNVHVKIQDTAAQRTIYLNGVEYTYRIIRYPFYVADKKLLDERANHHRIINPQQEIVFYLPSKEIKNGYIYSGLPTEVKLNVPLYIDAPFELITSREQIIANRWNDMIWTQLRKGYTYMLETIAPSMRIRTLQYLSFDHKFAGRTEIYNFNLFNSDRYNDKFADYVSSLRTAAIIPTFDKAKPLTSIQGGAVLYPSIAQNLIPQNRQFVSRPLSQIVNTNGTEKYTGTLKAMKCQDASSSEVIRFLVSYAATQMDDEFAVPFWSYIREQKAFLTTESRDLLKRHALIPVLGNTLGSTEYIPYTSNIFTEPAATTSPGEYYVLKTKILPKDAFEAIFGVSINEMNERYRKTLYQENLRQHLWGDTNTQLYTYLIKEFRKGRELKTWGEEVLTADKSRRLIPLKNELGEIRVGQIYPCDESAGYFDGTIVASCRCSEECNRFAEFAGFKELREVYFEDLNITSLLTQEDIDDLQDDYFKHGSKILEACMERNLIPEELISANHLGGLQKQEYPIDLSEFPNEPIRNLKSLQDSINNAPVQRIVKEDRIRQVDCIQHENGTTELFDKTYARKKILSRYTPLGKNHCICQMCLKGKPSFLMEVNNLQSKPAFYWPEMRLSLCLECSKKFEDLRSNAACSRKFEQSILAANGSIPGPVKVPIGNDTITFTQTHLVQIQMILKKKLL